MRELSLVPQALELAKQPEPVAATSYDIQCQEVQWDIAYCDHSVGSEFPPL